MLKKFDIHSIIAKIISAAKDVAESGQQNIIRLGFSVIIAIGVAFLATFSTHGDVRFLHIFDALFLKFKLWLPILFGGGAYLILGMMMRVNSDSISERFWNVTKDENGIRYAKNGTYGTAQWLSKKEAREKLEVEPIQSCNGVILGSYDAKNREVVCIPRGEKQAREITNQNVGILGSPGEGKSWGYVRCNMLQAIRRGESVIVTDPKGELYTDMFALFKENGYEVKVFNLANPQKSDAWNAMDVCYNKATGNVDLNRVKIFVEAIMKNTSSPNERNDYWQKNERALYEAVIMYMAEKYTKEIRYVIEDKIVKFCNANDSGETYYKFRLKYVRPDAFLNDIKEEAKQIFIKYGATSQLCELVIKAMGKDGFRKKLEPAQSPEARAQQFDEFFEILTKQIVKPTLSNVYHKINKLDIATFKGEVDSLNNPTALCHIPLDTILQQGENVWGSFTNGCSVRLSVLNDAALRLLVSEEDIDLAAPGRRKCAYFCIFPDQDFTFQFVSSLFFTFLFKDQIETADATGGNPVPINYIMDEFCNVGMVPDFSNKISTARSRNIGITMIVQAITQLHQVYTEEVTNTILGCCSTTICLGVNDEKTIEYIVKQLGDATILQNTTRKDRQAGRLESIFSPYAESVGEGSRGLMLYDELRRIDPNYQVVICSHLKPMRLRKVFASAHPLANGGKFEKTIIADIVPFIDRYPGCEQRDEFAREQYNKILADQEKFKRHLESIAGKVSGEGIPSEEEDVQQSLFDAPATDAEASFQLPLEGAEEPSEEVPMPSEGELVTEPENPADSETLFPEDEEEPLLNEEVSSEDRSIASILGGTNNGPSEKKKKKKKKAPQEQKNAVPEKQEIRSPEAAPVPVKVEPPAQPVTVQEPAKPTTYAEVKAEAAAKEPEPVEKAPAAEKPQAKPQSTPPVRTGTEKLRSFARASVQGKAAPIENAGGRSELRAIPVTDFHKTSDKEIALLVAYELAAQQGRRVAAAAKAAAEEETSRPAAEEAIPLMLDTQSIPVTPVEEKPDIPETVEFIPDEPATVEFIPVQEEPELQVFEIADPN